MSLTYNQIAEIYGLHFSRIQQIEKKALEKMRKEFERLGITKADALSYKPPDGYREAQLRGGWVKCGVSYDSDE